MGGTSASRPGLSLLGIVGTCHVERPLASRVRSLSVRHTSCTSRWNPGSVRQMPRQRGSSARPIWCGHEDRKHIAEEAVSYSDELGSSGVSPFATASIQSAASSDM
jgi:hypothetical protein